jgi:hypothetical protein
MTQKRQDSLIHILIDHNNKLTQNLKEEREILETQPINTKNIGEIFHINQQIESNRKEEKALKQELKIESIITLYPIQREPPKILTLIDVKKFNKRISQTEY